MGKKNHENIPKSSLLCFIYGECYDKALTEECICMDSEREGGVWKLAFRLIALTLVLINLVSVLILFEPMRLLIFFTNWAMELTIALIVVVVWCSFDP